MRIEDNKLARKLLDIRSEMNLMRAHLCCQEHAIMLDDVTYELLEEEELTALIKGKNCVDFSHRVLEIKDLSRNDLKRNINFSDTSISQKYNLCELLRFRILRD